MNYLDESYWTQRYEQGATGWDIGYASTPLVQYLDQIENRDIKVLIPGGGNGYEAAYAFEKGFQNTFLLDFAKFPLTKFRKSNPQFPEENLLNEDFFTHKGDYDLILEQTFFCALHPDQREAYCEKMKALLKPNGKIVGVLFSIEFERQGPPFGGKIRDYEKLFSKYFDIIKMEPCYNSIPPRRGAELFFMLQNQKSRIK